MIVRVGTRGSALSRAQTQHVLAALARAHPDVAFDVREIRTRGDTHQNPFAQTEGIGFFTAEIERALLAREVDLAVHSFKDLPTAATPGLVVAAVPPRAAPWDAILSNGPGLDALPAGARVGTSSPRRAAQCRQRRPDVDVVPLRGNIDTRLRKVRAGDIDAAIVAAAGFERLGLAHELAEILPPAVMLPAPAQGALAVQVREGDASLRAMVGAIEDAGTRRATAAERAFLARLQGGCTLPAAALATGDRELTLTVLVLDGLGTRRYAAVRSGPAADAERLGRESAEEILDAGFAHENR